MATTSKGDWVDFKTVKTAVSMLAILEHYGIAGRLKKKGDELRGKCPLHDGEGTDTFHASLTKNAFQCFSCKAKGNVLDFVAAKENCSVRDAALMIADWFGVKSGEPAVTATPKTDDEKTERRVVPVGETIWPTEPPKVKEEPEERNKPLAFELQGIQFDHPYLRERGIDEKTAHHFGVGFFPGKGSMSGRVVIPIHDHEGKLVAYAGRSIDGSEPKYKFPAGFKKSMVLYNAHRVDDTGWTTIVVEGFFDCMRVWQLGHNNVVALMGCTLSPWQEKYLSTAEDLILMLDGDEAGRKATAEILLRLARHTFVNVWELPEGKQPDNLTEEEFEQF